MSNKCEYPDDMDDECVQLCEAINLKRGIQTIESCCGHGRKPFRIWFVARDLNKLPDILYWFDVCHTGYDGWRVEVTTDCGKSPVVFMIEGPVGAYDEAEYIAEKITDDYKSGWKL